MKYTLTLRVLKESDADEYNQIESETLLELASKFTLLLARLYQQEVEYYKRHMRFGTSPSEDDDIPF